MAEPEGAVAPAPPVEPAVPTWCLTCEIDWPLEGLRGGVCPVCCRVQELEAINADLGTRLAQLERSCMRAALFKTGELAVKGGARTLESEIDDRMTAARTALAGAGLHGPGCDCSRCEDVAGPRAPFKRVTRRRR